MNRREFLSRLAAIGCVAAAPKIIFDCGANKFRSETVPNPAWVDAPYEEIFWDGNSNILTINTDPLLFNPILGRRFDSNFNEVPRYVRS